MSISIGPEAVKGTLNLLQNSGLEWQYRWGDGSDSFPPDAELYLLVGPDDDVERWDFDILAEYANLRITAAVTATIPDRTPFYLMFRQDALSQPVALALGRVKRWVVRA
ncbi:hypothetical protein OG563_26365 [Nocardia vinacea]|uniref:LtfC/p132/Gp6 beta-sandwich domain-containing protein n=1 Tax=Nocardia vinacea TaxID=96468 RepID=A0ABZ1YLA7_9NOCA|nr:hypothetical protein [Nocardia vinacea]